MYYVRGGLEGGNSRYTGPSGIAPGGSQTGPGVISALPSTSGSFGKGGEGTSETPSAGLRCGGGAGLYGGAGEYLGAGGGSGYVSAQYLKSSKTTTSNHTGDGECKIRLLSK